MKKQLRLLPILAGLLIAQSPSMMHGEDFSIAVVPDQHAELIGGASASAAWIASHHQDKKIAAIIQLGDILTYPNIASNWGAADTAWEPLRKLIGAANDPFKNMVATFAPGNHDYDSYGAGWPKTNSTRWRNRFGSAVWGKYDWYVGSSPNGECQATTFTKDGYKFLSIGIEYDVFGKETGTKNYRPASVAWLRSVLDANPNCPTMISTHSYLWDTLSNNVARRTPAGDALAQVIFPYKQVFMVNSAHVCEVSGVDGTGARNRLVNRSGMGPIQEMVTDYQNFTPRKHYLRLLNFTGPASSKTITASTFNAASGSALRSSRNNFSWTINLADYGRSGGGPPPVSDTTAPAAVALATGAVTSSSIALSWIAPGDDGNTGTAAAYDIRYSTAVITDANFNAANVVGGAPVPALAGTAQTKVVTGLAASTKYYFAIKAKDEVGNFSALSNAPFATTSSIVIGGPTFVKGINLNGPAVTIEGNAWLSFTDARTKGLSITSTSGSSPVKYFAATTLVTPAPATDAYTKTMLNSAVWAATTLTINQTIANGNYNLYLWSMENHQANFRKFDVKAENSTVATGIGQLALNTWKKYGPYAATVSDGTLNIQLTSTLGNPGVMGIAIYQVASTTSIASLMSDSMPFANWMNLAP